MAIFPIFAARSSIEPVDVIMASRIS